MSTNEPGSLYVGDSITWLRDLPEYPATAYVLHYAFSNAASVFKFDAVNESGKHRVAVAPVDSAKWSHGRYDWIAYVTDNAGTRKVVDSGVTIVRANPAAVAPIDSRSHARKMLDAIEAALERRASKDELDMLRATFGQRSMDRMQNTAGMPALIIARDKYKTEVAAEDRAAAIARGEGGGNKILIRFRR